MDFLKTPSIIGAPYGFLKTPSIIGAPRRVARIWKRGGGYFERVRSVQTTLTGIFIDLEAVSDGLAEN